METLSGRWEGCSEAPLWIPTACRPAVHFLLMLTALTRSLVLLLLLRHFSSPPQNCSPTHQRCVYPVHHSSQSRAGHSRHSKQSYQWMNENDCVPRTDIRCSSYPASPPLSAHMSWTWLLCIITNHPPWEGCVGGMGVQARVEGRALLFQS